MRGKQIAWIVAIAAALAILLFFLYQHGQKDRVHWIEFYRVKEKQPYDLYVAGVLLQDYFPKKKYTQISKPIKETLPADSIDHSCYIFIGHTLYFSSDDQLRLYEFVRQGNEAFLSANEFPYEFLTPFFDNQSYSEGDLLTIHDRSATLNFFHPDLSVASGYQFKHIYNWEEKLYPWKYFSDSLLKYSTEPVILAGDLDGYFTNFIKIPYGRGAFYLHTNPVAFTNYHLKEKTHVEYAEKVFSHLQPGDIYWDEFSKIPQYYSNDGGGNVGDTETPLRYVLSQASLKYAWYVLLAIAGFFLLFRTKRTQQPIPIVEPNANTSLEFIHTIGRLYYLQNDHKALALQKMKLFITFIRHRYTLQSKITDREFMQKLSVKSQISENRIRAIFEEYKTITNMESITEYQLVEFHQRLDDFYKQCK